MKSVFDPAVRETLLQRIRQLGPDSTARWGKMNVTQMVRHCILFEEMNYGKTVYPRVFLGRIFGQMAIRKMTKDDTPLKPNEPTSPAFKITGSGGDLEAEKARWAELIRGYADFSNPGFIHWFFGPMTREQIGIFAYKHTDHHLRQFGC